MKLQEENYKKDVVYLFQVCLWHNTTRPWLGIDDVIEDACFAIIVLKNERCCIFQFPGTPTSSSLSPFCIKLEAFCRLNDIKYEVFNDFRNFDV